MSSVGFESTIVAFETAKTVHALDRVATVIGYFRAIYVLFNDIIRVSAYAASNDWLINE
jgi:AMMECR1 domain-containing protein